MWEKDDRIAERFSVIDVKHSGSLSYLIQAKADDGSSVFVRAVRMGALDDWSVVQSAEARAETYRPISHSSLPSFVGYFTEELEGDAAFYLVYEKSPGESIEEIVKNHGPFPRQEIRNMIRQICEGLLILHSCDPVIVHKHINPSAIIREGADTYRILHLPMPRDIEELADVGEQSLIYEAYLPLEQKKGQDGPVSDLYSLGMTAVFGISGKHPHLLPTKQFKPQYHGAGDSTDLDRVIDKMIEPNVSERIRRAASILSLLAEAPEPVQSKDVPGPAAQSNVEMRSYDKGDSILVRNPASGKPESMLAGFLLDQWISKPWLIIIIVAALSAGPIALPLIIFLFHPKSRGLVNKAYARFRDVKVSVDQKGLSVSDQLDTIAKEDIRDIDCREKTTGDTIQLEIVVYTRNGKEHKFYISNLTRENSRAIADLIIERLKRR